MYPFSAITGVVALSLHSLFEFKMGQQEQHQTPFPRNPTCP
jgi:hypothetical protein